MAGRSAIIGRRAERERLGAALTDARAGRGGLIVLAGEAGGGKTRLAEEIADGSGALVLWGRASRAAVAPYGPVVAAFRSHLQGRPDGLDGCGPLRPHLALLLPELGAPPAATDRATLFEAVRQAIAHVARDGPVLLVLDDLQWSDDTTLELLPVLAESLSRLPVLVLAAYRSDGLPRDSMVRRMRHELRRRGRLEEIALAPLTAEETGQLLAHVIGRAQEAPLVAEIHARTEGVPFFVEELGRALATGAVLAHEGSAPAGDGPAAVPDTVRDAVLMGAADLSPRGYAAAEAAAVAGDAFDLGLVAGVSSAEGLAELMGRELIREEAPGRAAFRHAIAREALYADVPWLRRQALHRRLAEALENAGGGGMETATHWLGARDDERARQALLRAAADSRAVHAHRDAARAGRRALELWPAGDPGGRVAALTRHADSLEHCGELSEAARSWEEACAGLEASPASGVLADARRRLAAVHDLAGRGEAGAAARHAAVAAYVAAGMPAEAAVERLLLAARLTDAGEHSIAIGLARAAATEAIAAERLDLRARALGLEAVSLARGGDLGGGLTTAQAGLALSLEHGMTSVSAELYQRLSVVLYNSADYRRSTTTLDTALGLCGRGDELTEVTCLVCMIYVLRESGDWARATAIGHDLAQRGVEPWLAEGLLGAILGYQGRLRPARRILTSCVAAATRADHLALTVDSTTALAWVAAAEGADDEAERLCAALLRRWEESEDHHYSVRGLRWAAGFGARRGRPEAAHACAAALARIASQSGQVDALAGVAFAIGEAALADGDGATAAEQLERAVDLHRSLDIPYERAEIILRSGVALAAAGDRGLALERLAEAHRVARGLGARPLAAEVAREVAALGEPLARVLGRRAAGDADGSGLSRREREIVRHVAAGRTNREIADTLVLSIRTVDMHVRNLLRKLDCRSRLDAARRAEELGLLV